VLPREPGLEREAVAWFSTIYSRTQRPSWPVARPLNIIQVRLHFPIKRACGTTLCGGCMHMQPDPERLEWPTCPRQSHKLPQIHHTCMPGVTFT
jgi:hypothetical protein